MGNVEPLQDQADRYQGMKAEFQELRGRILNQAQWFNLLDPRSFGYMAFERASLTALQGPDPPTHAQHLDYLRSATIDWDDLRHKYAEHFEARLAEGESDITRLQERLIRLKYYLQDLTDRLDMLRKLSDIRNISGPVGAT